MTEIYSVNLSFHIVACRSFAAWNTSPGGTGGVMLIDRLSCGGDSNSDVSGDGDGAESDYLALAGE